MKTLLIAMALFFAPFAVRAVTPEQVVQSSLSHFPQVIEAMQNVEENEYRVQEARGAFDMKIKGEVDARTEGYYSGDHYKATIEKPFPFLNSRIYGGQRQGFGDFPVYEGKSETLNQGEMFAGVSLSLLRDALIDTNRYNLRIQKQEEEQSKSRLELMRINVQTMALKAYWMWLVKGHELKVYQEILGLAQTRAKQIARRIKAGDLAKIYESENNQYIRKREAQVMQSQLEFQQASYYLSLFYRDTSGKPVPLTQENLPALTEKELQGIKDYQKVYQTAYERNIELQLLSSQEKQAELEVSLGTNQILPKVDVNFEWNQDQGAGPSRLTQDENRVMLNIEVPLQFRKGLGKRRAAKAKLAQIQTKEQWTQEKLMVEVRSLAVKLNSFAEIYGVTKDQVKLSKRLAQAEIRKFTQGASDLILVNIREENLAEAQVKNLSSLLKYHFVDAEVRNIKVDFLVK